MDKLKLEKLGAIVEFMDKSGWENVACDMSRFDREVRQLLTDAPGDGFVANPLNNLFVELAVVSVGIAEAKYDGYCELLKNADNPELLDSIAHKHKGVMQSKESERNAVLTNISEAISSLHALQEKILQLGNIGQYAES